MSWRLANSLVTLRDQVNTSYPNRSKASDGTIGDAAHASGLSDHNPNRNGVVCALDLTDDPANGFNAHALAEHLRKNRHPNLRYVISNNRIAGWWSNWEWQPSSGHTKHIHVSVGTLDVWDGQTYDRYDDTTKWDINAGGEIIVAPSPTKPDQVLNVGEKFQFQKTYRVDDMAFIGGIWQVRTGVLCPIDFTWNDNGIPVMPLTEVTGGAGNGNDQVLQVGSLYTIPGTYTVLNIGSYKGRWMAQINMQGWSLWVDVESVTEV